MDAGDGAVSALALKAPGRSSWWQALALPLLLIAVWQLWALTLPPDTRARQIPTGAELPESRQQSLGRVLSGFAFALVLGVSLGVAMGSSRVLRDNLDPLIESFRPIAPMAVLPIAILWFGTGTPAALAIVTYAAFFPLLVNTVHGVSRVERKLMLAAQTMGVPRARILVHVLLPAALPAVLLGARLAMGVAWTAIIAAELAVGAKSGAGGSGGIGQTMFIYYAYSVDLNAIVVCMIVVGIVALAIDRLFRVIERRLLPWKA
jgi:ABC-type nitrate/sulfonate/bicarbonate transport system permease component